MTIINPNPPVLQKGDIVYYTFEGDTTKNYGKVNKVLINKNEPEYTEVWGYFGSNLETVRASTGQTGYIYLRHSFLFERLSWKQRISD